MIKKFTDLFIENKEKLKEKYKIEGPSEYSELVKDVVTIISDALGDEYQKISPTRIHEIDDGDYQGTKIYVISASGYQPSKYWWVMVNYGSCGGCDSLQHINDYKYDDHPTDEQLRQYLEMALHIAQEIKELS